MKSYPGGYICPLTDPILPHNVKSCIFSTEKYFAKLDVETRTNLYQCQCFFLIIYNNNTKFLYLDPDCASGSSFPPVLNLVQTEP